MKGYICSRLSTFCFIDAVYFTFHIAYCMTVKASPSSTEDQVTVCPWLASFILVRAHPTVFSASTCPLHCLCLPHQLTDWLLQYQVSSVCWQHSAACHSGRSQFSPVQSSIRRSLVQRPAMKHWLLYNNLQLNPDKSHVTVLDTTQQLQSAAVPASVDIAVNLLSVTQKSMSLDVTIWL